jgi:hypothetical protein
MRYSDRPGVPRRIGGYRWEEQERQWVALLECGHSQHVRHDPPLVTREWVTTEAGRAAHLGTELWCVECAADEPEPPR